MDENNEEVTSFDEGQGVADDLKEALREFFMDEEYTFFQRQWFMRGLQEGLQGFEG